MRPSLLNPFEVAKLLAMISTLVASVRVAALTFAALGQICTSELAGALISLTPAAQLVLIGAGEAGEKSSRRKQVALYLGAAALLIPQHLLIAFCG